MTALSGDQILSCFCGFTQKNVSARAHVSPPLLHDVVKLVS